jgi:sugar phosphate isomerase/epimerase
MKVSCSAVADLLGWESSGEPGRAAGADVLRRSIERRLGMPRARSHARGRVTWATSVWLSVRGLVDVLAEHRGVALAIEIGAPAGIVLR